MVQSLANAARPGHRRLLRIGMEAVGGAHLPNHAANPDLPLADGWDVVVVQGYSDEPIAPTKGEAFRMALELLNARILCAGSQTALFMTWAYKNQPAMTAELASAYLVAGQSINAQVVPAGLAFAAALRDRPLLALYVEEDAKHPSPVGTYLAACTFYAALYGRSPVGAGFILPDMPHETALFLQETAWQTVRQYYQWPLSGP